MVSPERDSLARADEKRPGDAKTAEPGLVAAPREASMPPLSLKKRIVFACFTVVGFLALLEVGLRLAGLGQPPVLGQLQFGYAEGIPIYDPDGIEAEGRYHRLPLFEADDHLFWQPLADTQFTDAHRLRKPGPLSAVKPQGGFRVVVLGDSCSFLGESLYPDRFAAMLSQELGRPVGVVNASCPGYTSFQGRRRLETLWAFEPDLLVVYFGWNDHWPSLNGATDADVMKQRERWLPGGSWLTRSRIVGLLRRLASSDVSVSDAGIPPRRVPPDDYRRNLQDITLQAIPRGCRVMFLTAPTAFVEGDMPPWAKDFFGAVYRMTPHQVDEIPQVHAAYNQIAREVVAATPQAILADLAAQWDPRTSSLRFRRDGIHLSEQGHQEAAAAMLVAWRSAESRLRQRAIGESRR